MVRDQVFKN